jgi:hypothetical protein
VKLIQFIDLKLLALGSMKDTSTKKKSINAGVFYKHVAA